ncbi:hypothetical protein OTU49_005084 [Cherax quadricarinatus]|uniref:Fibronectin type-III domain-containing protein n=1 Tax=Cherax quadricarinatus TaxID=27406 RepID=A0AAW0XBC7_CHEQU
MKVGVEYLLTVTAANMRGSSPPITITYTPMPASANKVVLPHAHDALSTIAPFFVLLMGVLLSALVCVGVGTFMSRKERWRKGTGEIMYARSLKDIHDNTDFHTVICVSREFEKEETMMLSKTNGAGAASLHVNPGTLICNSNALSLENNALLRRKVVKLDSLRRCSTAASICTTAFKTITSRSSSTMALNPEYLVEHPKSLARESHFRTRKSCFLDKGQDSLSRSSSFLCTEETQPPSTMFFVHHHKESFV